VKDFAVSDCASWIVDPNGALYKIYGTSTIALNDSDIDHVACGRDFCAAWSEMISTPLYWFPTSSSPLPAGLVAYTANDGPLLAISIGSGHALLRYSTKVFAYGNDDSGQTQGGGELYNSGDSGTVRSVAACLDYSVIATDRTVHSFGATPIPWCSMGTGLCFSFPTDVISEVSCAGPVAFVLLNNGSIYSFGTDETLLGYNPDFTGSTSREVPRFAQFARLSKPSTTGASMFVIGDELALPSGTTLPIRAWGWGANHYGQLGTGSPSFADTLTPLAHREKAFDSSILLSEISNDDLGDIAFYSSSSSSTYLDLNPAGLVNGVHSFGKTDFSQLFTEPNFFPKTAPFEYPSSFFLANTESDWISLNGTVLSGLNEGGESTPVLAGLAFDFASVPGFTMTLPALKCGYVTCIVSLNASYHIIWGSNETGQIPAVEDVPASSSLPFGPHNRVLQDWNSDSPVTMVSLARDFTAVMYGINQIRVFGRNVAFQDFSALSAGCYQLLSDNDEFTTMSTGYNHTLVLERSTGRGRLLAFGNNDFNQLGHLSSAVTSNIVVLGPQGTFDWLAVAAVQHASFGVAKRMPVGGPISFGLYSWGLSTSQLLLGQQQTTLRQPLPAEFPNWVQGVEALLYVNLCQRCRGSSMFVFAQLAIPSVISAPNFAIPELEPSPVPLITNSHRISFGENEGGSLGVGSLRSPILPSRMAIAPTTALSASRASAFFSGNMTISAVFTSHSAEGTVVSRPSDPTTLFWRSYRSVYPDYPVLRSGYSMLSIPSQGSLPTTFVDATGDSGVFGVSVDTIFSFNFSSAQWVPERTGAHDLTSIRSMPIQSANDTNKAWAATQNLESTPVISTSSTVAGFFDAIVKEVFMSGEDEAFAVLIGDVLSVLNGSNPIALPNVVGADMNRHIMAARRSDFSVWTIQTRNPFSMNLLGRTTGPALGWGAVTFPAAGRIVQVECASLVTYALDHTGNVFAWGLAQSYLFGTYDSDTYYEIPRSLSWTTDPSIVAPNLQVTMISSDSWRNVHFWLNNRTVDIFSSCDEVAPSSDFICIGGNWVLFQPFLNNSLTVIGYTVAETNITLFGDINFGGIGSSINSSACVSVNGSVVIVLSDEEILQLLQKGSPTMVQLITALCGDLGGNIELLFTSNPCINVGVEAVEDTEDGYSLSALFSVSESSSCQPNTPVKKKSNWWIIVVAVLGGVILLVAIIALLITFAPLKAVVRPFSKRAQE
jgi:alpha-tubulin suppressor-like RCC1 family protein